MWDIRTVYLYNTDVLVSHPYEGGTLYLYSTDELVSHPYDIERSLISYGWDIRSSVWDKDCTDEFQISTESVPHRCVTNSSVWHDFNIDGSVQHCSNSNALAILHWAIDIISHGRIDLSHKSHNASHKYPIMHHFVTEMCTFLLQNVALWDMAQMHSGICEMGLLLWTSSFW